MNRPDITPETLLHVLTHRENRQPLPVGNLVSLTVSALILILIIIDGIHRNP